MMPRFLRLLPRIVLPSLLCVTACTAASLGKPPTTAGAPSQVPAWVTQGSGAFGAQHSRLFAGVGYASCLHTHHAAARAAADTRARAEVAHVLQTFCAALLKEYANATAAPTDELRMEQHLKALMAASLGSVIVAEHYAADGTLFSLAQLLLDDFIRTAMALRDVPEPLRLYVHQNAERLHTQIQLATPATMVPSTRNESPAGPSLTPGAPPPLPGQ